MSRRKTGAENPCPPPASAGPLFDSPQPAAPREPDQAGAKLAWSCAELVDALKLRGLILTGEAKTIKKILIRAENRSEEVDHG